MGIPGAMVRSAEEWLAHPQGQPLVAVPTVEVVKIADGEPVPFDPHEQGDDRPLSGMRVLDVTRVLAGPTCARTLAEHGAEVLKVNSPVLPYINGFVVDTGHGKRSCLLDLKDEQQAETLRALVQDADVFSQGYRGGAMERLGFDQTTSHQLAEKGLYMSPSTVMVTQGRGRTARAGSSSLRR
jgi:hypothetical protein